MKKKKRLQQRFFCFRVATNCPTEEKCILVEKNSSLRQFIFRTIQFRLHSYHFFALLFCVSFYSLKSMPPLVNPFSFRAWQIDCFEAKPTRCWTKWNQTLNKNCTPCKFPWLSLHFPASCLIFDFNRYTISKDVE